MRIHPGLLVFAFMAVTTGTIRAQDSRELVRLQSKMQEHMLDDMRDHLRTLNDILGDVANDKFDDAAKSAEHRLGMSSPSFEAGTHMTPLMPKGMQDFGASMHHAASRLAIVLQNAAVSPTVDSMRNVDRAIHDVTSACVGCHAAYRIR